MSATDSPQSGTVPSRYLTVAELNGTIRKLLDSAPGIHGIWLLGEFSNVKQYPSGHTYAVLKDQMSELRCVIWRNSSSGIGVHPKDGMKAFCYGDVIVSEQKGRYEFSILNVIDAGSGSFFLRMELLKAKLKSEGLFDRKRQIPSMPSSVALVTSGSGAVVHDMLKIIARRFPLVRVIICPVKVQGSGASEEITAAIGQLNSMKDGAPEVIVLARGGGSIEDLWSFNEENVARAIFASEIPVVTGIGHQTDFTIADFVADLRAATPSEAAEKIVPDRNEILAVLEDRIRVLKNKTAVTVSFGEQLLDSAREMLCRTMDHNAALRARELDHLSKLLESLDPSSILERGYASVTSDSKVITSISQVSPGDGLDITLTDGTVAARVGGTSKKGLKHAKRNS